MGLQRIASTLISYVLTNTQKGALLLCSTYGRRIRYYSMVDKMTGRATRPLQERPLLRHGFRLFDT